MLKLTRKKEQTIVLTVAGHVIEVKVLSGMSRVDLGITAPPEVVIQRGELLERGTDA